MAHQCTTSRDPSTGNQKPYILYVISCTVHRWNGKTQTWNPPKSHFRQKGKSLIINLQNLCWLNIWFYLCTMYSSYDFSKEIIFSLPKGIKSIQYSFFYMHLGNSCICIAFSAVQMFSIGKQNSEWQMAAFKHT